MASATGYAGARSAPIATGRRSAMSSFDEDAASHKHRKRPTYRRRRVTFGVQGTNGLYLAIDVGIRVAIAQLERGAAFNAIGDLQRQAARSSTAMARATCVPMGAIQDFGGVGGWGATERDHGGANQAGRTAPPAERDGVRNRGYIMGAAVVHAAYCLADC